MAWVDWTILASFLALLTCTALMAKHYTRSVADFLAANRAAGKYLLAVGDGMAGLGAISLVAMFQQYYEGGFTQIWWHATVSALTVFVAITGWVVFRFRQTRALTLGQFFEIRYSRRFRIFAGLLLFISGIINFGIFPSVGARFAIYFCDLPESISFAGFQWETYPVLMAGLITLAYGFTFLGGQVAVVITDFLQGAFCHVVFILVLVFVLSKFSWGQISSALATAPENQSRINPFDIGGLENYDSFYWLIMIFAVFYATMGWQGQQAYNSSATNPHEARMAKVLGYLRYIISWVFVIMLPICVFTMLNHADFATQAAEIEGVLATIENEQVQSQMRVPVALRSMLPLGLMGLLSAAVLAAFISTHDTYMHSWGCIFLQDVVLPFRKTPFTPEEHLRYLRLAILGVCVFIFLFSYLFEQRSDILMFMALSGAIFLGGSGAVIIGGLYWRRGTTAGAWTAMLVCMLMATMAFVVENYWDAVAIWMAEVSPGVWTTLIGAWPALDSDKFPLTPQEMYFLNMVASSLGYIAVSLFSRQEPFNMDKMLHRGKYAIEQDISPEDEQQVANWKSVLGLGKNLSLDDKMIMLVAYSYLSLSLVVVVIGSIYHFTVGIPDEMWLSIWAIWMCAFFVLSIVLTIWLAIGGAFDLRSMLKTLSTLKRDHRDSGMVE